MSGRRILLARLLALAAVTTAVADPCGTLDFFPTADAINAVLNRTVSINGTYSSEVCTGDMVCNAPVFHKPPQEDGLLTVVLPTWAEAPKVYFTVNSPLLTAGADAGATCCAECTPATARRLLSSMYDVTTAGAWSYTVAYGSASATAGSKLGSAGVLSGPWVEGDNCATVTVTIDGFQVNNVVQANLSTVTLVQKVCWYKPSSQATASITLDMCDNQRFTVNISDMTMPVPLKLNGTVLDGQFILRPVVQVYGNLFMSLDGTVVEEATFDANSDTPNFINHYIMPDLNATSWSDILPEDVAEGYYNLSMKVFMMSDNGGLIADPKNTIEQFDNYGNNVQGKTEVMSRQLLTYDVVGLQKSESTVLDISSDKTNIAIKTGDNITFTWSFAGIMKKQECYHDTEQLISCTSPLVVAAKNTSSQHTFRVVFTDMCGKEAEAKYTYSATGVTVVTPAAGDVTPVTTTTRPKSSAVAATVSFGMSLLGGLLVVAIL